jgi:hypothetical protein
LVTTVYRRLAAGLTVALLTACASSPEDAIKPVVKTIAIVPATDPKAVSFESRSTAGLFIPIAGLIAASEARSRQAQITAALQVEKLALGDKLTQHVAAELRKAGYEVEILTNLNRPKDYPDSIDIRTVSTAADAILQLQVSDLGIYSGLFSGSYVPRVSTYGLMYAKGRKRALYDAEIHYGAHAEKGKDWAVEADPKYSYTGPDDILGKAEEVKSVFTEGSVAAGRRMTEQLLARLR